MKKLFKFSDETSIPDVKSFKSQLLYLFILFDYFVWIDDDVNGRGESQQKMIEIDDNGDWEGVFHYFAISEYMIGLLENQSIILFDIDMNCQIKIPKCFLAIETKRKEGETLFSVVVTLHF